MFYCNCIVCPFKWLINLSPEMKYDMTIVDELNKCEDN